MQFPVGHVTCGIFHIDPVGLGTGLRDRFQQQCKWLQRVSVGLKKTEANIWNNDVKSTKHELVQTSKSYPLLKRAYGAGSRPTVCWTPSSPPHPSFLHHTCSCPVPVAFGRRRSLVTFIRVRNVFSIQDPTISLKNSSALRNIKCTEHWRFC